VFGVMVQSGRDKRTKSTKSPNAIRYSDDAFVTKPNPWLDLYGVERGSGRKTELKAGGYIQSPVDNSLSIIIQISNLPIQPLGSCHATPRHGQDKNATGGSQNCHIGP